MALPEMLSITELATLLGLPRHQVEHWCERGTIPTVLPTPGKRYVVLETLRERMPEVYEAIVRKGELADELDDVDD